MFKLLRILFLIFYPWDKTEQLRLIQASKTYTNVALFYLHYFQLMPKWTSQAIVVLSVDSLASDGNTYLLLIHAGGQSSTSSFDSVFSRTLRLNLEQLHWSHWVFSGHKFCKSSAVHNADFQLLSKHTHINSHSVHRPKK